VGVGVSESSLVDAPDLEFRSGGFRSGGVRRTRGRGRYRRLGTRWVTFFRLGLFPCVGNEFSYLVGIGEMKRNGRSVFESVDAVVLATPEFGGGAAGAAKNALDWMVGSGSLYEKPCGVVSAGTTGGPNSIHQIARTLAWQGAFVVATLSIATPWSTRNENGHFTDAKTLESLGNFASTMFRIRLAEKELVESDSLTTIRSLGIHPVNRSGR
jgi:NADPH-dependent FMN reductase